MEVRVIGFTEPIVGLEGEFNTFRLGMFYYKTTKAGERVFLLNEKRRLIIGSAIVLSVHLGDLKSMCAAHGANNHVELARGGQEDATLHLYDEVLRKIYGPHIIKPEKKCTVIYLRRES